MNDNSRKISSEEIEKLYQFTRQHYVEYYDVQTELVDHLASAIEEAWSENPETTFEENLNREFKKFGVFGFMEIVEKRQAAMQKKYLKLMWQELKSLLKRPKVLLPSLLLFGICKFLLLTEAGFSALYWGFLVLCLLSLILVVNAQLSYKKKKKSSKRMFLLEELIYKAGNLSTFFIFPIYILNSLHFEDFAQNIFLQYIMAVLIPGFVLLNYISFYKLPKKRDEILQKVHPELKFLE